MYIDPRAIFDCQKTYSIHIENIKQQAQIEEGTDG